MLNCSLIINSPEANLVLFVRINRDPPVILSCFLPAQKSVFRLFWKQNNTVLFCLLLVINFPVGWIQHGDEGNGTERCALMRWLALLITWGSRFYCRRNDIIDFQLSVIRSVYQGAAIVFSWDWSRVWTNAVWTILLFLWGFWVIVCNASRVDKALCVYVYPPSRKL